MPNWVWLGGAIILEVIGTTALQQSAQFTRIVPTMIMAVCYGMAFYALSVVVQSMPMGVVYAIWSGMGIVLISAVAWIWYRQTLDTAALLGLALIIAGVMVVNLFSKSVGH